MFSEILKLVIQHPMEAIGILLTALSVVSSVLNAATEHWTEVEEFKVWRRRVLAWIERLSVVQSKGAAGLFKLPGFDGKKPPKLPGVGTLWTLALVLCLPATGCTAAQQAMWADLGKGALKNMAPAAADSLCAIAAANCDRLGGDACVSAVTMGCHYGKAKMVKALDDWIKDGKKPDAVKMQTEVRAAIASDPALMQFKARAIPMMNVKKIETKGIGFKVPTKAEGGAGVTDSAPVEVK
jgi:hypothetical protein